MREILFRAKRIDSDNWVEGNIVMSEDVDEDRRAVIIPREGNWMFSTDDRELDVGFETWYKVAPETVCQYTGLTDKNGRKIFEGDIVKEKRKGLSETIYSVVWDLEEGSYMLESKSGAKYGIGSLNQSNFEVIGNIFDNPELIGE